MSSWSKFHEKHGNVTSKRPRQVYGSYISDPRQYERSASRKRSIMTTVVSCLGCLVGRGGGGGGGSPSRRRMKEEIDTRYMYNNTNNSFEFSRSTVHYLDSEPIMKKGRRFQTRRNKSRGNINYLQ